MSATKLVFDIMFYHLKTFRLSYKRRKSLEERKIFAKGLDIVLTTVLEKYVKEELKEECKNYLVREFNKVRQFSDLQLIEGIEQELMMKKKNKKVLEKENVKEHMKNNMPAIECSDLAMHTQTVGENPKHLP